MPILHLLEAKETHRTWYFSLLLSYVLCHHPHHNQSPFFFSSSKLSSKSAWGTITCPSCRFPLVISRRHSVAYDTPVIRTRLASPRCSYFRQILRPISTLDIMFGMWPNNPMFDRSDHLHRRAPTIRVEQHFFSLIQPPNTPPEVRTIKSPR